MGKCGSFITVMEGNTRILTNWVSLREGGREGEREGGREGGGESRERERKMNLYSITYTLRMSSRKLYM